MLTGFLRERIALGLLIAVWLAAGLFGRDPWKPDEAYNFGVVHHILNTGDWVVPAIAGEPFMEKPPLFYITAAFFAHAFGSFMPLHDAARLACAFYVGLTLLCTALTARALFGRGAARAALLFLMGCIGYFHSAHLLVTDNALVAGVAIALYGLAIHRLRPALGGIALGTGTGVAFLAKGLIGPGMVGLTALALLALPAWRTRDYARTLAIAALALAPWLVIWPAALYARSPALFHEWLIVNNFGRYTGTANLGPAHDHWMYVRILPLFALPALPLAAWSAWRALRRREAQAALPLAASTAMLALLSSACNSRDLYALPMLVPLSVAAAAYLHELPRACERVLRWLGLALGTAGALALWLGWGVLIARWPAALANALLAFRPQFSAGVDLALVALALAASAGALALWRCAASRLPFAWAYSVTFAWALFFTLWLPYEDYGNSYRGLVAQIKSRLPRGAHCIAGRDLGEPQRAMLEYFGGIVTQPEHSVQGSDCEVLLVQQQGPDVPLPPHRRDWLALWRGARPGDATECFSLFASMQLVAEPQLQEIDPRVGIAQARVR